MLEPAILHHALMTALSVAGLSAALVALIGELF